MSRSTSRPASPLTSTRPVLARYTPTYLRFVWHTAAGLAIGSYAMWVLSLPGGAWPVLSLLTFVVIVLHYAMAIDAGIAGSPEAVLFSGWLVPVLGVLWLTLTALAVIR